MKQRTQADDLKDQIKKLEAEYWQLYREGECPSVLVSIQNAIMERKSILWNIK